MSSLNNILTGIFKRNLQEEVKPVEKNDLQKVYEQVGETPAITKGLQLGLIGFCSEHGMYPVQAADSQHNCPICSPAAATREGDGTTATQVEHWIDIKDQVQAETGYRPQG